MNTEQLIRAALTEIRKLRAENIALRQGAEPSLGDAIQKSLENAGKQSAFPGARDALTTRIIANPVNGLFTKAQDERTAEVSKSRKDAVEGIRDGDLTTQIRKRRARKLIDEAKGLR